MKREAKTFSRKISSRQEMGNFIFQTYGLASEFLDGSAVVCQTSVDSKRRQKQIVLYGSKQRDRIFRNGYLVEAYSLWDGLSRGLTDGALVRIASLVGPGETKDIVD